MSTFKESKSLRWLANQFPYTPNPKDDTDKMCNAIHRYATAGADKIDELEKKQTPKKPSNITNEEVQGGDLAYFGSCLSCGFEVSGCMKYCVNCGQRLDWGVRKNETEKSN